MDYSEKLKPIDDLKWHYVIPEKIHLAHTDEIPPRRSR
jgi:hypothetical protein